MNTIKSLLPPKHFDPVKVVVDAGDFHFGAKDDEHLAQEYETIFNSFIEENKEEIDLLVISGDLFHKELKTSSDSMRLLLRCFTKTLKICESSRIQVRLLQGTMSHDRGQVETLGIALSHFKNFKVITSCCAEEIYKDFKVLYIPEEYPKDMKEFYKEAIFEAEDKAYDFVFFHGTIDFQAFASQAYESELSMESAPVFKADDLIRICKGAVTGGHIHTACDYKEKVFYHGSFSRTCQGEPKSKGFMYYVYDSEKESFDHEFVENTDAPIFKSLSVDELFEGSAENLEVFMKTLEAASGDKSITYRFVMSEKLAKEHPEIKKVVSDFTTDSKNLNFQIKHSVENVSSDETQQMEDEEEEQNELAFLADPALDYSEKIQKFMETKFCTKVELDKIRLIISGET